MIGKPLDTELLVQTALRAGVSLEELQLTYHLIIKRHPSYPNLVFLKYHQLDSPMGERLVQQCRGLILDEADQWRTIARPFDKFFNYGEGHAAPIDWSKARVQEKLDGSLCILYHYDKCWHVATSGTPDASGVVNGHDFTFKDLFWKVWQEKKFNLPSPSQLWTTFLFELLTPYNRVVVHQEKNDLKLIGARHRSEGWEMPSNLYHPWNPVTEYNLNSLASIIATFDLMDPLHQEGYVVVDHNGHRIKVKHPGYVAIHHLKDGFGPRRVVDIIRGVEGSEVLSYFPEWKEEFARCQTAYDRLVEEIELAYSWHKDLLVQKDYALAVKALPYSGVLFALRKGKVGSVKEALKEISLDTLMSLLKIKVKEEVAA